MKKLLVVLVVVLVAALFLATSVFAQGNTSEMPTPQAEGGNHVGPSVSPTAPQNSNGVGGSEEKPHGPCPTPVVKREGSPAGNGNENGPRREGPNGPNCPNCPVVPTPMPNDSIIQPVIPPMGNRDNSITPTLPTVEVPVTTTIEAPTVYRVFLPIIKEQGTQAPTGSNVLVAIRTTTITTTTTTLRTLYYITKTTVTTTTTTTQQQAGPDLWALAVLGAMGLPILGFTRSRKRIWIVVLVLMILVVAVVPNASASPVVTGEKKVRHKPVSWSGIVKLYNANGQWKKTTYGGGYHFSDQCHYASGKQLCKYTGYYRTSSYYVALSGTKYAVKGVR